MYVPVSCCKSDGDLEVCVGRDPSNPQQPPKTGPPIDSVGNNTYLYTDVCRSLPTQLFDPVSLLTGLSLH